MFYRLNEQYFPGYLKNLLADKIAISKSERENEQSISEVGGLVTLKYLLETNILDEKRKTIFLLMASQRSDYISSILICCYYLQKKEANNAKKAIKLPNHRVDINYGGRFFTVDTSNLNENGLEIKSSSKHIHLTSSQIQGLVPWINNERSWQDLDTIKRYSVLIGMEKEGVIFNNLYYADTKPHEGLIIVTRNKEEIKAGLRNGVITSNNKRYFLKDFFEVCEFKLRGDKFELEYVINPSKGKNKSLTNFNPNNPEFFPTAIIFSYDDIDKIERLLSKLPNFYKTFIFDSFNQYYDNVKPYKYASTSSNDEKVSALAGERLNKLSSIFKLFIKQQKKEIKDIFFLSSSKCPEVFVDFKEKISNNNEFIQYENFKLYGWLSTENWVINNTKENLNIEFVPIEAPKELYYINQNKWEILTCFNRLIEYLKGMDACNEFIRLRNDICYEIPMRFNNIFNSDKLCMDIKILFNLTESIIKNHLIEDAASYYDPILHYLEKLHCFSKKESLKLNSIKKLLETKAEYKNIVVISENNNEDDLCYLKDNTRIIKIVNRKTYFESERENAALYIAIDFLHFPDGKQIHRDLLNFWELILEGRIYFILFHEEVNNLQRMWRSYNQLYTELADSKNYSDLLNMQEEDFDKCFKLQKINTPSLSIIGADPNDAKDDVPDPQSAIDKLFGDTLKGKIKGDPSFKKSIPGNHKWVLQYDDLSFKSYPDGQLFFVIDPEINGKTDADKAPIFEQKVQDLKEGDKVLLFTGNNGGDYMGSLNELIATNPKTKSKYLTAFLWLDRLKAINKVLNNKTEIKRLLKESKYKKMASSVPTWLNGEITTPDELSDLIRAINEIIKSSSRFVNIPFINNPNDVEVANKEIRELKRKINSTIKQNAFKGDYYENVLSESEDGVTTLINLFRRRINEKLILAKISLTNLN